MANYVSQYLKRAGVTAPYEDLTEAQLNEKDKMNPLSGYGFMSAKEKQTRASQRALYQQQMDREQQMLQQQLLSRMSSQQQIGYHGGAGLMGLIDQLRKRSKSPEAPQDMGDDPAVARFNELSGQVGPAVAKQMLGQEMNNPGMIADAQKEIAEEQKRKLDIQNLEGQVADRKNKPNSVITTQRSGPNGQPMQVSQEVTGKGPDGLNTYKELGEANKGSTVVNKDDWGRTTAEKGKTLGDFEMEMTNTENYLDVSDRIKDLASKSPTGPGFAASLSSSANNLVYGFEGIKKILSGSLDNKAKAKLAASDPVAQYKNAFDNIRGVAKLDSKVKALLLEQAYLAATAKGQRATDADIENQLKILGGSLNDPEAFSELIQQNRELTVDRLSNMSKNTGGENGRTLGEVYSDRLKGIGARRNPGASGVVKMKKGDKTYSIPADKVEAAEAAGYTRG